MGFRQFGDVSKSLVEVGGWRGGPWRNVKKAIEKALGDKPSMT